MIVLSCSLLEKDNTHMQSECYQPKMVVDLIAYHCFQLASSVVLFGVLVQLGC